MFAGTCALKTMTSDCPAFNALGTEKRGWLGFVALTVVSPVTSAPLTVTLSLLTKVKPTAEPDWSAIL